MLCSNDIEVVMECLPKLPDLESGIWPRQVASSEMRLAKRDIQKKATLAQNSEVISGQCILEDRGSNSPKHLI